MNKKIILSWIAAGLAAVMSMGSMAGTVSLTPPNSYVNPGDPVNLALSLDFGSSEAVGYGGIDISFDPTLLAFGGFDFESGLANTQISALGSDGLNPGNQFFTVYFEAADIFTGLSGPVNIGNLALTTNNSFTGTTIVSFRDSVTQGGLRDTSGDLLPPFAGSASITAVPVPAAVWLMASGLLGMVGLSRRT